MEHIINLHLTLYQRETGKPVSGDAYKVKFYDKDPLKDDFLGESTLDDNGHAIVSITESDYRSNDTPFENHPDVYFCVWKGDEQVYKSETMKNLHLDEISTFTVQEGMNFDLGKFVI